MDFKVLIEKDEDGWFVATVPSLPGCISQGKTEKEAIKNIKEAIELHLSSLAEDGLPIKQNKHVKETLVSVEV
ncbi:MAG: type II toxin-antitoxin system HicB family antitoxin [Thermoplasmata archaeon]|jgi:predicted RNase H-like HicB family nuclease|nr:MAG: type II toxin-antitoxin system HicB family antitoxin [Thermoplasmata archaeon]UCE73271.1 MAG: type II toxin-antitoxin system HicB family antitoxin [Methanomassiliicoccales archaeon]